MSIALPVSHVAGITPASAPASVPSAANAPAGCLNSAELLRGKKAVEINHNGFTYRLLATRLGKLILTK
ncbi:hemin uptake protein HemP [Polaromonas sp.]|uniref:hemin uptake protein HemP n=1 Tax=Polaromonas sp. TaxID=1869339 RepID=UPI0017B0F6DB|nr:hemin uptake protein HemP [Polaromonas sp.]NMM04932.1 hemin uptake protein HemP [Polaromonas sp.]